MSVIRPRLKRALKLPAHSGRLMRAMDWAVKPARDGVLVVGHGGWVAGYTAHVVYDPDTKFAVILLRNYNQGRSNLGQIAEGKRYQPVNRKRGVHHGA